MNFLKSATIACLVFTIGCKSEPKNETSADTAETVAEASAEAVSYAAETENSTIEWKGFKPTGTHTGFVNIKSGNLKFNGEAIEGGDFTIDMNTITVTDLEGKGKDGLEAHLKGTAEEKEDHFFNVAEFPTASFAITGLSEAEGKKMLEGNLTIKGITKNIAFPVSITSTEETVVLESEPFTINRTDWNVNYGSKSIFADLGDKFINDEIELKVSLKANKG
ncbi:YceI family protein [Robertkochia solimangrovi]|uniref:YceI family protein n=1 Tax=Robertkochia solimangrovi TaxID=2213046 RepID=UPI0030D2AEE8